MWIQPYIPDELSIWEFDVSSDAISKADDDYLKGTKKVTPTTRADATFVFVTPRIWTKNSKIGDSEFLKKGAQSMEIG